MKRILALAIMAMLTSSLDSTRTANVNAAQASSPETQSSKFTREQLLEDFQII